MSNPRKAAMLDEAKALREQLRVKEGLRSRVNQAEDRLRDLRRQLAWRTEALVKVSRKNVGVGVK